MYTLEFAQKLNQIAIDANKMINNGEHPDKVDTFIKSVLGKMLDLKKIEWHNVELRRINKAIKKLQQMKGGQNDTKS